MENVISSRNLNLLIYKGEFKLNRFIKRLLVISFFSILLFSVSGCSLVSYKTEKKTTTMEVQSEEISPDGVYKAYSYVFTDGGATVPFRRGISIINADEEDGIRTLMENSPNIYLNNNSGNKVVSIKWEDNTTLKVDFTNVKEDEYYTYLKVDTFNGIKIIYEN